MAGKGVHQGKQVEPEVSVATPEMGPRKTFWQQPFVLNALPLATSVLLHAGILLVGYATYQTVKTVNTVMRDQIIIPDATLVEGAEVGGLPNPGLGDDPNIMSDVKVDIQEQTQKLEKSTSIASGIGGEAAGEGVIGIGAAKLGGGGLAKGDEAGRSLFGVPGGSGGLGPKAPFMGVSGNAYRVIYVCDASELMLNLQTLLKDELYKAVDVLKPNQLFNVVFFPSDGGGSYKTGLVPATPANKLDAIRWIHNAYKTGGTTDPVPALRVAMAQEPELVYLLTNGFEKLGRVDTTVAMQVRDEIRRMNPGKRVRINTILVRTSRTAQSPLAAEELQTIEQVKKVLKEIAEENGGRYKVVDR